MEEDSAAVMAEMLGFNPALVMPQLQQELQENIGKGDFNAIPHRERLQ